MGRLTKGLAIAALPLVLGGCFESKKDVSELLSRAQDDRSHGDLVKAEVELRQAVAANPKHAEANFALAQVEEERGDLQSAVPHYLVAAVPDARLLAPQLRIVQLLLDSDRLQDAAGRINTTLGSFPNNAEALALKAEIQERQGDVAPARTNAEASLQKDPANARALAVQALLDLRDRNSAAALATVDRGLKQHPNDLRLLQVRAAALLTLDQPDKAIEALTTIVHTQPRNVTVQKALAQVEASSGRVDEAIAHFRAAVAADPSNQDMQLAFISFLASRQKDGDAVAYLRDLIAKTPQGNTYDLVLAEYLRGKGQIKDATSVLDSAAARLKQGPEYNAVLIAQAKLDAQSGHLDKAVELDDAVLKSDPDNSDALLFRAALDIGGRRPGDAVTRLLSVVRGNPVNAQAFQLMATAYMMLNKPDLAAGAMQRAASVVPGDEATQIRLAAFLQNAGQMVPARDLITRLTLQNPSSVDVWQANGQLAIARKDWGTVSRSIAKLRDLSDGSTATLILDGQSRAAQGDATGAAKVFENALTSDPKVDPGIVGAYAKASAAVGRQAAAADFLEAKVASFPEAIRQQAWAAIMTLRADAGQFDRSAAAFQNAVRLSPRDPDLYQGYIRILTAQKKWDAANATIAAGLAAGCPPARMLIMQGSVYELAGNIPSALSAYKRAVDADPLALEAANNYGSLLADLQPKNTTVLAAARESLSGAEQLNDPLVLDTMAWLDYRLGRFDEAKQLLTQANAGKSDNPQLRFHLAAVMLAGGDRAEGMALLDTVKGLDFPGADEARSLSAT